MLEIKELKKSYKNPDGTQSAIVDVQNFILGENNQIALRGASGTGKSTFLNLISGILKPDSGSIIISGTDITKLSESQRDIFRSRHIGYIFQTFNLLQAFNALENVMLGQMFAGRKDDKKASAVLERMGLGDKKHKRPSELSVGEQQRTAIARAVVNSPSLLLADEPTANLDPANSEKVIELIKEVCAENKTALLIVSHEEEVIRKFDNVKAFAEVNTAG